MHQVLCHVLVVTLMAFAAVTSAFLAERRGYKAAVYAHRPVLPPQSYVTREGAVKHMMANVEIYKHQAELAARQGAEIIVFPEDGIYGFALNRTLIRPYLEPVPDPRVSSAWVPCTDPGRVTPSDILTQLSCIARFNRLYVVANMGDIKPCEIDKVCPPDGHYHYNTDVVFDASGRLVARYHKRSLFGEKQFDTPSAERITFDTPFGRFGVFTCFDILFYDPAVVLMEQGIQNVVFPTAWMDSYPLLDAVGFHSAWARGHGVNFLAANIQLPERRFSGSGVYTASGALGFHYDRTALSEGRLVVVDVPIPASLPRHFDASRRELPCKSWDGAAELKKREGRLSVVERMLLDSSPSAEFDNVIAHDAFKMVEANDASGTVSVCKGNTCCKLTYARDGLGDQLNREHFAFGVSEAMHDSVLDWYVEACVLVRCTNSSRFSCGQLTWDSSTMFSSVVISGNFSTRYIYPQVLVSNNGQVALTPPEEWQFTEDGTLTATRLSKPLLTASLYARDYTKDPH